MRFGFKARMILYAAYGTPVIREDGSIDNHPHWFELAKEKWAKVYQTTGTPCSCWAAAGCAGAKSITVGNIRGKLCALFENQWSRNRKAILCVFKQGMAFFSFVIYIGDKFPKAYHKIPIHNYWHYQAIFLFVHNIGLTNHS